MEADTTRADAPELKRLGEFRGRFRALILENPNYFGNLPQSPFAAVMPLKGNTTFEELGCVGYQPQTGRLEAVVYVKQPSGYGGGLCGAGTQEYVRFFASWDHGGSWTDLGLAHVTAWDIPQGTEGERRLEYAVTRRTDFRRRICTRPQVVLIRAILSWHAVPPAGDPAYDPVWGNTHDTWILVEPLRRWRIADLFEAVKVKPAAELLAALDLETLVAVDPKPLSLAALRKLYDGTSVEPHRFALPVLHRMLTQPGMTAAPAKGPTVFDQLGLKVKDLAAILAPKDGSTAYEQLECIGYDPDDDSLVGVIRVKLPQGYSGAPCSDGSREYVTFWADPNGNGTFETCLGTASVRVYDLRDLPRHGLEFAVHLPADLLRQRIPCRKGPRLIPIRAILSWQVAPPCANPNFIPVWGNRLETLVHVKPGDEVGDKAVPMLSSVGGIPVTFIDGAGLTQDAVAVTTGAYFNDAPFGGRVNLAGKIINGTAGTRYRVMIRPQGVGVFLPLNLEPNGVPVLIVTPGPVITSTTLHVGPDGYYGYEDYAATHYVEGNILAIWQTGEAEHGNTYELRIDVKDPLNPFVDIQSNVVAVHVDNHAPILSLAFDLLAGDCAHFPENATFTGTYSVTDAHFGGFSFEILPAGPAHGVLPTPPAGASVFLGGAIGDPGVAGGSFTLNTTGMDPCGYALILHGADRTNVNSGQTHNTSKDAVGFCLGSPPTP